MVRCRHEKSRQRAGVGAAQRVGRRPRQRRVRPGGGRRVSGRASEHRQPLGVHREGIRQHGSEEPNRRQGGHASFPPGRKRQCFPGWPSPPQASALPAICGRVGGWRLLSGNAGASISTATTSWSGCAPANSPRRSPPSPPKNATRRRSAVGSKRTGRASKKSARGKRPSCVDRRERLLPEPAGAPHLGTEGQNACAAFLGSAKKYRPNRRRVGATLRAAMTETLSRCRPQEGSTGVLPFGAQVRRTSGLIPFSTLFYSQVCD